MGGECSRYEENTGAYRVLVGKPEGMRPLRRSMRRWENNIKNGSSRSGMMEHGLD